MSEPSPSSELVDERLDAFCRLIEKQNNRLTFTNRRFVERYFKGELHILVQFRITGAPVELIADFQRAPIVLGTKPKAGRRSTDDTGVSFDLLAEDFVYNGVDAKTVEACPDNIYSSVLVDVVELVQYPEYVPFPSLVRFSLLQDIDRALMSNLYFSMKRGRKLSPGIGHGVRNAVVVWATAPSHMNLHGEVIQGPTKVVEGITHNNPNASGNVLDTAHVIDCLSALRITIFPGGIGAEVEKSSDQLLSITDVFFGPFEF